MQALEKTFEDMDAKADEMKESEWSGLVAEFTQAIRTRFLRINAKCNNEQQMHGEEVSGG